MSEKWLTVKLVEEIQERVEDGQEIDSIVSALQGATLPGLVEYRCLRRASNRTTPPLPPAVSSSTVGKAFHALRPPPARGRSGVGPSPRRTIRTQPVEFYLIGTGTELESDNWKAFTIRFARSAQGVGLDKTVAGGLRGALLEMADNAVIHAQTDAPVLVGYRTLAGFAQFCVADVGIGVLNSLRSCPDFSYLRFDHEAIKEALRDGVSRYGRNQGGMGFREIFKALAEHWGLLRFRSGEGCIMMDGTGMDADHSREEFLPRLPGFQVTVSCRKNGSLPPEPLL
jgi:anti-sigma regulatory factor (Ser/Thr protein kinase)